LIKEIAHNRIVSGGWGVKMHAKGRNAAKKSVV
jgi:hypothetical protein